MASPVTTHVVLFKFKAEFAGEVEAEAERCVGGFVGAIPGVLSATFGRTFTTEFSNGFTHMLVVVMSDPAKLEGYGPHPVHQAFATKFVAPFKLDIMKMDIHRPVVSL